MPRCKLEFLRILLYQKDTPHRYHSSLYRIQHAKRAESRFTIWDLLSTLSHCHHQRTLLQNFKTTNNHAHSLCAQTNLIGEPYTDVLVFLSFSLQKQEDEEEYSEGLEVFTEQMNIMGAYRTPLGPTGRL